jgi:hypothetical protein
VVNKKRNKYMKKAMFLTVLFAAMLPALLTPLFAQELPRLAVVEFATNINNERITADAVTIRNLVQSQMVRAGRYRVMTRTEIDTLIAEQRIALSEISSAENRERLGLQHIRYIVTGTVDAIGNDYMVTLSILNVSSGQFSHSELGFIRNSPRELFDDTNTLVVRFISGMSADEAGAIVQGQGRVPAPTPAPQPQPASQPITTPQPIPAPTPVPAGMVRIPGGTFTMGSPANELGRYDREVQPDND